MVLAAAATALLVGLAALAGPAPRAREVLRNAARRTSLDAPQGRALLGLHLFGVALGVPLALGLAPGTLIGLLGCLAACTLARGLLSGGEEGARRVAAAPAAWFAVLAWSVSAAVLRYGSPDLGAALGAQAVLGPGPLLGPPAAAASSTLAGIAALAAAAAWVTRLPRLHATGEAGALDEVLRWGEAALAGASAAALAWGPSLGALVHGPAPGGAVPRAAASLLLTCCAVAGTSALRRWLDALSGRAVLLAAAAGALASLGAAGAAWPGGQ